MIRGTKQTVVGATEADSLYNEPLSCSEPLPNLHHGHHISHIRVCRQMGASLRRDAFNRAAEENLIMTEPQGSGVSLRD